MPSCSAVIPTASQPSRPSPSNRATAGDPAASRVAVGALKRGSATIEYSHAGFDVILTSGVRTISRRAGHNSTVMLEICCYGTEMGEWSFLTNHARALLCIAHDPGVRLRDIGEALSITERSAYAIVSDLTEAGYVLKEREGRRNRYVVQRHLPLPENLARERTVGEILQVLVDVKPRRRAPSAKKAARAGREKPSSTRTKRVKKRK